MYNEILKSVNLGHTQIIYLKSGIIHIKYSDYNYTIEDTKKIFYTTRKNSPWEKAPMYLTGSGFTNQDNESKAFNASPEVMKHCSAIAFLSPNLAQQLMANFFIKIYKPSVPTKFFTKENQALEWLQNFVSKPEHSTYQENSMKHFGI
jgi:hypothetical protein